jgi:uncharacterized protein DUF433
MPVAFNVILPSAFGALQHLHYRQMLASTPPYVIVGKPEKILAMDKFDRITFDPRIMGGRACIRGMRLPASVIIGQIAHGASTVRQRRKFLQIIPIWNPVTSNRRLNTWPGLSKRNSS